MATHCRHPYSTPCAILCQPAFWWVNSAGRRWSIFRERRSNANAPSFIIDWSQGTVAELPQALRKYQVSFYSGEISQRVIYVVYYAVSPDSAQGYVYLPGKSEEWSGLNVRSILRGVEGKWFHAWSTWENIARPLIEKAKAANSTHPA